MQKNHAYLIHDLLSIVNSADHDSSDIVIARALLENREILSELSMKELSGKYYVSQSAVSRFIKKIGYDDFRCFREAMEESMEYISENPLQETIPTAAEVVHKVQRDIIEVLDGDPFVDPVMIEKLCKTIRGYKNIWIYGAELTVALLRLLQTKLLAAGYNCYTIAKITGQRDFLPQLGEDDLLLVFLTSTKWLEHFDDDLLRQCKAHKIMVGLNGFETDAGVFDEKFSYGKPIGRDYAYYQLTYLIMIIDRMF